MLGYITLNARVRTRVNNIGLRSAKLGVSTAQQVRASCPYVPDLAGEQRVDRVQPVVEVPVVRSLDQKAAVFGDD